LGLSILRDIPSGHVVASLSRFPGAVAHVYPKRRGVPQGLAGGGCCMLLLLLLHAAACLMQGSQPRSA
jgi:hypothetical protein